MRRSVLLVLLPFFGVSAALAERTAPPPKPAAPPSQVVAPTPVPTVVENPVHEAAKAHATALKPALAAASASATGRDTLCGVMRKASAANDLPLDFFTRLIWQESRFDPAARSPAGAEGVAQFMPSTASGRGLADPFEPSAALRESAAYLKELRQSFGNLGLAAAAYNAGPGRLGRWIAGETSLPQETLDYVEIVTGHSVFDWHSAQPPVLEPAPDFSCRRFSASFGRLPVRAWDPSHPKPVAAKPWAVILVGAPDRTAALSEYNIVRASLRRALGGVATSVVRRHLGGEPVMKYVVQIEADDRQTGDRICKRLASAGGNCVVLRNILR